MTARKWHRVGGGVALFPILMAALLLGGCDQAREALGKTKRSPDEFAVYQRAPLSLPPDFNLRPPAPGAAESSSTDAAMAAKQAVFGPEAKPGAPVAPMAGASVGIQALLKQTGAMNADPNIRTTVNRETSILAEEEKSFAERIMFWNKQGDQGVVVNPEEEMKRIQDNQALGRPITDGETPTIDRKKKGLLEGLF